MVLIHGWIIIARCVLLKRGRNILFLIRHLVDITGVNCKVDDFVIDLRLWSSSGWTPLIHAAFNGKLDVVESLVKMKANVEAKDKYGSCANKSNSSKCRECKSGLSEVKSRWME